MGAIGKPATVFAGQRRGIAAAVDKHQRLLAPIKGFTDVPQHLRCKTLLQLLVQGRHHTDFRRACIAGAVAQAQVLVATGKCVVQALQRRRGGAKQHRYTSTFRQHNRQVARGVAHAVLLFEGAVVLLVDQNHPEARQRGKDRGAGADDDIRHTAGSGEPGAGALAIGEARVQSGNAKIREARRNPPQGLRREADLRHQQQRLVTFAQGALHQAQVNFGLAAARGALQ